jgi:hypothetical protein
MRQVFLGITGAAAFALVAGAAGAAGPPSAPVSRCAADAVVSGAAAWTSTRRACGGCRSRWREQFLVR